jgi:hypothetical protein
MTTDINQLAMSTGMQMFAGLAIGTLVDSVFPPATAVDGPTALKEGALAFGQLLVDGFLSIAYFDFAVRRGYLGNVDGTKSFAFTASMLATQRNLWSRLSGLSQYTKTVFTSGVFGALDSSKAMVIRGVQDHTSNQTVQVNAQQNNGDTEMFDEE